MTEAEHARQREWVRLHDANPGEAVLLAAQGADPRHPTAGARLAQLRADRRPPMKTYRYVGDIVTDGTNEVRPAYQCPDCGALVESPAAHDVFHAKVDGMFRALDHHLMRTPDEGESP